MELRTVGDALIYLGAIAAALAAIGLVARWAVVVPLRRWLQEQIQPPLERVHAEMSPDSGLSLRDAVTRIERAQERLGSRLADHLANHPGS